MNKTKLKEKWGNPVAYMPLVIIMLTGFIAPMFIIIKMSVISPTFSFKHYISFFSNATYLKVFFRTFRTAFTVTVSCLLIGYPVAFYLANCVSPRAASYLRIFIVIPFWVSILIRTFAWKMILSNTGVINVTLMNWGIIKEPLPLLYNSFSVHISMIHILLPFMILTLYGVMKGINPSYFNAALNLGATPGKAFLQVYLPMSVQGILAGSLMVFIQALGFYITPSIVGGSKDTMLPVVIEMQVNRALNWNFASAMAVILLVTTIIIIAIYTKLLGADELGVMG